MPKTKVTRGRLVKKGGWPELLRANFDPFAGFNGYGDSEMALNCRLLGAVIEMEIEKATKEAREETKKWLCVCNEMNQEILKLKRKLNKVKSS